MRTSLPTVLAIALVGVGASGCLTVAGSGLNDATGDSLAAPAPGDFRQGRSRIDEEDFYRIAGDARAVEAIRQHRAGLVNEQIWLQVLAYSGIPAIVASSVALGGGIVMLSEYDNDLGIALVVPGALLLMGSIAAIPLGLVYAEEAGEEMLYPVLPHERALDAADRYNAALR